MSTKGTVTATDLSPIQPTWYASITDITSAATNPSRVPPNVKFEIDDAESPWTWDDDFFDLVHMRTMTGCIRDFDKLFEQAYRYATTPTSPSTT
jgi:hypothetical protein